MGPEAIYPKPRLSKNNLEHKIYPYLLRNLDITGPNQVWCSDITYSADEPWLYLPEGIPDAAESKNQPGSVLLALQQTAAPESG